MRTEYRLISLAIVSSQVSCNETIPSVASFFDSFIVSISSLSHPVVQPVHTLWSDHISVEITRKIVVKLPDWF